MDNVPIHGNSQTSVGRDSRAKKLKFKFNLKNMAISIGGAVILIGFIFFGLSFFQSTMGANIDGSKYQAVFFTNGQVYFGKLQTLSGDYMKLTDIYYLQTKTASSTPDSPQTTSTQGSTDVTLIKLGNEIHGPEDSMVISKNQILFFENLKKDSKVSTSIDKHEKK